ncbi:Protein FAM185A [Eumeta japonica]|uniref:Protein FAM185A n=1 Tax=Eumeta variegata TaxID=151549 RepID=A0A4C1ZRU3_EUMVA|nr:Protein FAM185A [Eumeta japonica]
MRLYSQGKDASDFQVQQSSKRLELFNKNIAADCNDVCLVEVPYQLKVHVTTTENASVHMEKLEGEEFLVKTQGGSVKIKDIKAQNISINSVKGELTSEGKLQASNIEFKTGLNSSVKCENIRANNFVVTTHAGLIVIKSCHSDKSHITTAMGDMYLDHMHRSVLIDVIQQANLHINGFSGQLQASLKSGNVFMLAAQLIDKSSIFIHEKGKVEVLMPDIINKLPEVNLIADKIQVDEKILKLGRLMIDSHPKRFRFPAEGEKANELNVVCKNGSIELKETDVPFVVKMG